MGLTLNKAAEWTSAQSGAGGKLVYTPINQTILEAIMGQAVGYTGKNPDQGRLVFKQPLTWNTGLTPSDLGPGFANLDGDTVSQTKDNDGKPLVVMRKRSEESYEVSVRSMEQLENILGCAAGDRKIAEVRACLEFNRDPVARMLGDRFSTVEGEDGSLFRYAEEIMKSSGGEQGANAEVDEKKMVLKMALEFHNLDVRMMRDTLSSVTVQVRLTPQIVESEIQLLKEFVGKDEEHYALEILEPTGLFTFVHSNGCRAPPWRQLHGEIGYFLVKPHDTEELSVTASTNGWFINQGLDAQTRSELDFEKVGDVYKDLITLLKDKSPKFAEFVNRAEFRSSHKPVGGTREVTYHRGEGEEMTGETEAHRGAGGQAGDKTRDGDKKSQKKKTQKKKKLEPSLKWQYLGLTADGRLERLDDHPDEKKERKTILKKKSSTKWRRGEQEPEDSFSESSSESEEEEEAPDRRHESNADLPSEYWQIGKLVKYLKGGNQTSTIISLCALRDFPLHTEVCQLAVRDVGGLEILINLLETDEVRCKIGSLKILKEISRNPQIRRAIADLGGLQTMVNILKDPNRDLKCLSAETIANVAKFRRARRTVRQHGGIRKLVALLDCPSLTGPMNSDVERDIEVARCGALALWSCSKSTKTKKAMKRAGVIPLLARLLKSPHEDMLIPVVGTLQECASEASYRVAIRTEGMIEDLVKNLKSANSELQMHCASTIFKCAEEKETRDLVRHYGGLDPLVALLGNTDNKELLAAATGAIWKCAISTENIQHFQEHSAIDKLVQLLNDQPEEVLVNVVGALGEMANDPPNRAAIRKAGGVTPLVHLLTGTNQALLVNVTRAVGQCAEEPENMVIIDKLDGVRLLWSLLKNPNPEVQSSAAWAICPCIENAKDAGEMVRSFVGGLELIVSLLKSDNLEVLASVSAAIAKIAKDEENLAVITDHGVVNMLARLTDTSDDRLRQNLAEAIALCCSWGSNRIDFGRAGAVAPLVKYLRSHDEGVHRSTARALFQLSKHPDNCITMHEAGVVKLMLGMVGAANEVLQEAAAGCIGNIRRLAMANEKSRQTQRHRLQGANNGRR